MKILFLTSDKYPPFRVDVSVLFSQELPKRGFNIDWVMQSADECKESYTTNMDDAVVYVGRTNNESSVSARLKKHYFDIKNDFSIFTLLKSSTYDFIQVKDKFIMALIGAIVAKIKKVKFIYWLSYPFPEASIYQAKNKTARYPMFYLMRGKLFKFILYRLVMPLSDHVFVQSEKMKSDVVSNGINSAKLTAVPMGVLLETIPYYKTRPEKQGDEFIIVYLGTLAKVRKMDFLVRVLKIVKQDVKNATLYLVGDGEDSKDREVILNEAEKLNISSSVKITGYLSRENAFSYVNKADVCVSPFFPTPILNSTSPTKLVEYMALGKPVVANDHPEQKKVISESNCGLCVGYSEKEFADAIIKIQKDLPYWENQAKNGREYVKQYRTYEKIADLVERKYKELV